MFANAEAILSAAEKSMNAKEKAAKVPYALQVAMKLTHATNEVVALLREQHSRIRHLEGENQHLRDINHTLADQMCQKTSDPQPEVPEEPVQKVRVDVCVASEQPIPDEVKARIQAFVDDLNNS